ncbi:group XIIB secretory phospholipase A2-like protein isoform 2-T2 [Polymixia lowei]
MLLRIVVLLHLCLSSGMCATLGQYQAQATEEELTTEAPASDAASLEVPGQENTRDDDTIAGTLVVDIPVADKPVAEVHIADSETAAAEDPTADTLVADEVAIKTPAADEPEVSGLNADDEQLGPDADAITGDTPASDAPFIEPITGEAVGQETPAEEEWNEIRAVPNIQTDLSLQDSGWGLNSIRGSFQTINGYFDSLVELVGGRNGVCHYRCRHGISPQPRPGYQVPEPNGCSSSLAGFQFDLGIPAMTKCCDQLDVCYDTCGANKYRCDAKFRWCLHGICSDLKKSLGFVSKVQTCESMADTLYNTVWALGCRPYMNSQRAACFCEGEERDEL